MLSLFRLFAFMAPSLLIFTSPSDAMFWSQEIVQPADYWMYAFHSGTTPDPYWEDSDSKLRNMSYQVQKLKFTFTVPMTASDSSDIVLKASGLGDLVRLSVNGKYLSSTNNTFREYLFSVKHLLKDGLQNQTLTLEFQPSPPYAAKQALLQKVKYGYSIPPDCPPAVENGICHVNFLRTRQSSYCWDWGPAFPTIGTWFPIVLIGYSDCFINQLGVLPIRALNQYNTQWSLRVNFDLYCASSVKDVTVSFKILELPGFTYKKSFVPNPHSPQINITLDLPKDADLGLWWPNGYGAQSLYTFEASLAANQTLRSKFGFRHVELIQDAVKAPNGSNAGLTFYFKVNGVPIFLKGSNWIPKDSFLSRVTCDLLEYYFQQMVAANFNALRVWGGGIYEQSCFYEFADKYGILIWQDFMFASSLYSATPEFLGSVRQEVIDQINRLKSHPSILVWAGNNENEAGLATGWWKLDAPKKRYIDDYLLLYNRTIRTVVNELDGTRPFVLSSPSNGLKSEQDGGISKNPYDQLYGDTHFYDYNHDPWNVSTYPIPRLASEFGFQSLPAMDTWLTAMPEKDLGYFSEGVLHRQHHPLGEIQMVLELIMNLPMVPHCDNLINQTDAAICFGESFPFNSLIYLTQINQAMAIRIEVEHYRRMKSTILEDGRGMTMGALYWQLNDIWQAPSWASIDYFGRWKMLHYYAKVSFEPLMVSIYTDQNRIFAYVISDLLHPINNVTFCLDILSWDSFDPVYRYNVTISTIVPLKAKLIYKSPSHLRASSKDLLARGRLFKDGKPISSDNIIFLSKLYKVNYHSFGRANITKVTMESNETVSIELSANQIAPFVWLEPAAKVEGTFSENGFIMTTSTKSLHFNITGGPYDAHKLTVDDFTVKTLRDVYA